MDHTRKLATFSSNLSFVDLPFDVVDKAKLCILDYIANTYGSLQLAAVDSVISYFRSVGTTGGASVFGCGFTADIHHAAFINGTTGEAIEAQDGYRFGGNHPGAAVIPAALLVGEALGRSGREVIEAVVAGYEAANRPAAAMHPWHTLSGFLPTGTCGAFGAAAAAARLRRLDDLHTVNALGNAGYLLPLSMAEHLMGGHTIKIVQAGQAAAAGIMAAGLAENGLTACPSVLEGTALNGGFTQITTKSDPKPERISEGLGEHYTITDVYIKPYTACRHTHGAAQATLELAALHDFSKADIDSVAVSTYGIAELAVGKTVSAADSFVSAQFSIPYVVAACLADKMMGPGQITEKRMADEHLLSLAKTVSVATDPELNAAYPEKTATRVEIRLKDGRTLRRQVDVPRGDPRNPMTVQDVAAKVRSFAGGRKGSDLDRLIESILDLEKIADIRTVTNLL